MLSVGSLAPRIENAELNSLGNFFPSFHFPYGMSKDGERPSPPIEKGNIGNQEQSLLTQIFLLPKLISCLNISSSVFWLHIGTSLGNSKNNVSGPAPRGSSSWSGEALSSNI